MSELGNACGGFSEEDLAQLTAIVALYDEAGGIIMKLASWAGAKAESLREQIPPDWNTHLDDILEAALKESYRIARATQPDGEGTSLINRALTWAQGETWHKLAVSVTGAVGGIGGISTTLADLPVTTTLILRSIQQIAGSYGEDLNDVAVQDQCLAVFGLGGPLSEDDGAETGLFASRLLITGKMVSEIIKTALPKFGVVVSQKLLVQAAPIIGAVTGATINAAFSSYYQTMAHVHFRLRMLEKVHDPAQIQACFERILKLRRSKPSRSEISTGEADPATALGGRSHSH